METTKTASAVMWGVGYRQVGDRDGRHFAFYGEGDLTEADAAWMAERWEAEQAHIEAAWVTSRAPL